MQVDLVYARTSDGVGLSGAYFEPRDGVIGTSVDAFVFFHGDGGNFYNPLYLNMGAFFAARGIAFLSANRRGHDVVANGGAGGTLGGYAHESVSHSVADFAAWIELLRERGHKRIVIGGHSGGAVRAVYARAMQKFDEVVAVVSVSPGEYHHDTLVELHGDAFLNAYNLSLEQVENGNPNSYLRPGIPWGSIWTSQAFVVCFNEDNRYSVTAHAERTQCSTLFVFGSEECSGPQELPACGAARLSLEAKKFSHTGVTIIDGADHGYVGREQKLYETILDFLSKI